MIKDFISRIFNPKTKASTLDIGKLFFEYCVINTKILLENKEYVERLGITNINREYLFRELIIIHMYTIVYHFRGVLKNTEVEFEILDMMRFEYYKFLREYFRYNDKKIEEAKQYLLNRFTEYEEYSGSQEDDFKISKIMMENLSNSYSVDLNSIMTLSILTISNVTIYDFFKDITTKYEIFRMKY